MYVILCILTGYCLKNENNLKKMILEILFQFV
jgi:hypothetical protein